jgi:transposase
MTALIAHIGSRTAEVIIGVDTHRDEHVAVAINEQGVRLGEHHVVTTKQGYAELHQWSRGMGAVRAFGIEGTGSYGAGVARFLTSRGYTIVEVNRPDRSTRRLKGKSDPTDAEMAARAVLAGVAHATPKSGEGEVEMIRMLKNTKDSAVKARTQAINQMKALVVTAPVELRETLHGLAAGPLATRCARLRPGPLSDPAAAVKYALRSLARRYRQLAEEIRDLEGELGRLTRSAAPALVDSFGIGPDTAATLLVAAGSNPERLHSEAAFAALCGVNPIPASSGKTNRHRLNRGGDRQANAALYRIVLVRLRHDQRTKAYMQRRTGEGMSKTEVIRCLKRYVAREVFQILRELSSGTDFSRERSKDVTTPGWCGPLSESAVESCLPVRRIGQRWGATRAPARGLYG